MNYRVKWKQVICICLLAALQDVFQDYCAAQEGRTIPFQLRQESGEESLPKTELLRAVEAGILEKTNIYRQGKGLPALRSHSLLVQAARAYAADMLKRNYFSHFSPEREMVVDRIRRLKPGYDEDSGENLHQIYASQGLRDPEAIAAQMLKDWISSPTHRKNLMAVNFGYLGVGCATNGFKIYCVQVFAGPGL